MLYKNIFSLRFKGSDLFWLFLYSQIQANINIKKAIVAAAFLMVAPKIKKSIIEKLRLFFALKYLYII
jgi:hypothetical protein